MERPIPLWLFLLSLLISVLGAVFLAFAAVTTAAGWGTTGRFGNFAIEVAMYPFHVKDALREVTDNVTGSALDKHLMVPRHSRDMSAFTPVESATDAELPGLVVAGDPAKADRGWRYLGGAFMIDGTPQNGVVLLDPDLKIRRVWRLTEADIDNPGATSDTRKMLHGLAAMPDGSVILSFDLGYSLQNLSMCDTRNWVRVGEYHHSVTHQPETNSIWALRMGGHTNNDAFGSGMMNTGFEQIDVETGETLREFGIGQVIAANPDLGIFDVVRTEENDVNGNTRTKVGDWGNDPIHFNEVDPLPQAFAAAFPQFNAGDLLVSSRTLNLIAVIDPDTLKVKWYRSGATVRQHDPDWRPDGTISVFNNRMGRGMSEIITIDPTTYAREVSFDGTDLDFYTRIRGKHAYLPSGNLALTSPQQGRALEITPTGDVALEFYNLKPGTDDTSYALTEHLWFPENAINLEDLQCNGT